MPDGFTSISIANPIIKRIDKIFKKAGFNNRSSYIQFHLRNTVAEDELKHLGGGK